jgi:hypothetical protein
LRLIESIHETAISTHEARIVLPFNLAAAACGGLKLALGHLVRKIRIRMPVVLQLDVRGRRRRIASSARG